MQQKPQYLAQAQKITDPAWCMSKILSISDCTC